MPVRSIDINSCRMESAEGPLALDASTYVNQLVPVPEGSDLFIASLSENPQILALEFRDKYGMENSLKRISSFVEVFEKNKVPTFEESLPGLGHDLKIADVADFYNACLNDKKDLDPTEKELLDVLLAQGILKKTVPDGLASSLTYYAEVPRVLIAVDPSLDVYARRVIFGHEYSHALYFLDADFRSEVHRAFSSLAPAVKQFLKGAMIASGYYTSREDWLIETEIQAHAIEPQSGTFGFLNLFLYAEDNCDQANMSSFACEDFWSYRGNLKGLMEFLHDHYHEISYDRIPLLDQNPQVADQASSLGKDTKKLSQEISRFDELLKKLRIIEGPTKYERLLPRTVLGESFLGNRVQVSPYKMAKRELNRLQNRFYRRHEEDSVRGSDRPICVSGDEF